MKNRNIILTTILFALGSLALLPRAQAVGPDTDGSIPGSNNGEGIGVLISRTSGVWNTGTGFEALNHLTGGNQNTATGLRALTSDTNGGYNTATGVYSLSSNISGFFNSATGAYSLANNTTGGENTANGYGALYSNTADNNTANGFGALYKNTSGTYNTAIGGQALFSNTTGEKSTAVGYQALYFSTGTGDSNTATGYQVLYYNSTGFANTANGVTALYYNTTGALNTAMGYDALVFNQTGGGNTANGVNALDSNTTGSNNTALGYQAGSNLTTGDNNIDIGYNVSGLADEHDTIRIGNTNITDTFIRGISGATAAGGDAVFVTSGGHLGTLTSSARFKDEIKPMGNASEAILALRPVSFRYKKQMDPQGIPEFGLIAEEVEKVNPDLITRDREGKPYTVRYEQINAMLLNEFLKEHKKVEQQVREIQEQRTTISELMKGMETVIAHLKEQDSKIQKVSDEIEINKAGPGVVRNDPGRVESNTSPQ
jgi:hypothetical protein